MSFEIPIIDGDLTTADVDMIIQQCNCLTISSYGLSQAIKTSLCVDPYGHRRCLPGKKNCAVKEDRGKVGTVMIYKIKSHRPNYVACLFAQFSPSKPSLYHSDLLKDHIDPITMEPITDSNEQRMVWFNRCLNKLAHRIIKLKCKKVAFPYMIGCGLAGGSWDKYGKILTHWAKLNESNFNVVIIKK
jgi:O-acetyl-ADP-ribose deacetylase (regulator of RNase III)